MLLVLRMVDVIPSARWRRPASDLDLVDEHRVTGADPRGGQGGPAHPKI